MGDVFLLLTYVQARITNIHLPSKILQRFYLIIIFFKLLNFEFKIIDYDSNTHTIPMSHHYTCLLLYVHAKENKSVAYATIKI